MVAIKEEVVAMEEVEQKGEVKVERSYEEKCSLMIPIAKPLATRKLAKKLYKCNKQAVQAKGVRRGTKEVCKSLRKGEKGYVIIAGDVSPIDVISHFPVLCEENKVPYCYVPCKADVGASLNSNMPCSIVMVLKKDEYKDKYKECLKGIKELPSIF